MKFIDDLLIYVVKKVNTVYQLS